MSLTALMELLQAHRQVPDELVPPAGHDTEGPHVGESHGPILLRDARGRRRLADRLESTRSGLAEAAAKHSEAAREAAFAGRPPGEPRPGLIAFEETRLWVEEDLWVSSPFQS